VKSTIITSMSKSFRAPFVLLCTCSGVRAAAAQSSPSWIEPFERIPTPIQIEQGKEN
jgi:hypothetical protein